MIRSRFVPNARDARNDLTVAIHRLEDYRARSERSDEDIEDLTRLLDAAYARRETFERVLRQVLDQRRRRSTRTQPTLFGPD